MVQSPVFQLTLKNEKMASYERIAWLVIILNLVVFGYLAFMNIGTLRIWAAVGASAILLPAIIFYQFKKTKKRLSMALTSALIIPAVCWIGLGVYWAGIANLLLFALEIISKRKFILRFYENRILYPTFPARSIDWQELDNVVLKDGLITLDFRNNKVMQSAIDPDAAIDEAGFNRYCREKLNSNGVAARSN